MGASGAVVTIDDTLEHAALLKAIYNNREIFLLALLAFKYLHL